MTAVFFTVFFAGVAYASLPGTLSVGALVTLSTDANYPLYPEFWPPGAIGVAPPEITTPGAIGVAPPEITTPGAIDIYPPDADFDYMNDTNNHTRYYSAGGERSY